MTTAYYVEFAGILDDGRRCGIKTGSFSCEPGDVNKEIEIIVRSNKSEGEKGISLSLYKLQEHYQDAENIR